MCKANLSYYFAEGFGEVKARKGKICLDRKYVGDIKVVWVYTQIRCVFLVL
jgi:hypothetical protein